MINLGFLWVTPKESVRSLPLGSPMATQGRMRPVTPSVGHTKTHERYVFVILFILCLRKCDRYGCRF